MQLKNYKNKIKKIKKHVEKSCINHRFSNNENFLRCILRNEGAGNRFLTPYSYLYK